MSGDVEERFETLDKPIEDYILEQENKNTRAKTNRDVRLLIDFLRQKNYEPSRLRGFISSFYRHLKERKYPSNIIENIAFEQTRKSLEARCKKLKKDGKGNKPNAAQALTDHEINTLYQQNQLGILNAEALLNTLWLFNSLHFGLRGCDEHRQMSWGDIKLMAAADGTEHLEYSERQTKRRTGAEPRNIRSVKPKAFALPNSSRDRDPVVVYKTYREKRPDSMNRPEAPFYLGINHIKTQSSTKSWFRANAMGVNKLNNLMKNMATKAGLDCQRHTNHSARKRMIQKLNDNDVPPTHIMQLSGHKNIQSINNYSHVSEQQQKTMSRILSGFAYSTEPAVLDNTSRSQNNKQLKKVLAQGETMSCSTYHSVSALPAPSNPTSAATGLFSGAVINGGHFTININTVNKSLPTVSTTKQRSFKRIKMLESSDEDSPPLFLD